MNIEERCNKVVSLQSKIFKMISENNNNEYLYQQKLNTLRTNFETKKQSYTDEIMRSDKYNLEYIFLLEQYNLNRLALESKIKKIVIYGKRLTKLSEHLYTRKVQRALDIKTTFYEFNDIVQKELITEYESKIQFLKQRKILSDSFERYLAFLKENYPTDYAEKKSFSMTEEELLKTIEQKDMLKEEQRVVIRSLSEKFQISDEEIFSMQLSNPDVMVVAQKMYPNLKEELLKLNEIRNANKVVSFNENPKAKETRTA